MNQIRIDSAGVRAILTSPQMRAAVRAAADEIAGKARSATDDEIVVIEGGISRARAYVRRLGPNSAANEAKDRALGRSA